MCYHLLLCVLANSHSFFDYLKSLSSWKTSPLNLSGLVLCIFFLTWPCPLKGDAWIQSPFSHSPSFSGHAAHDLRGQVPRPPQWKPGIRTTRSPGNGLFTAFQIVGPHPLGFTTVPMVLSPWLPTNHLLTIKLNSTLPYLTETAALDRIEDSLFLTPWSLGYFLLPVFFLVS